MQKAICHACSGCAHAVIKQVLAPVRNMMMLQRGIQQSKLMQAFNVGHMGQLQL